MLYVYHGNTASVAKTDYLQVYAPYPRGDTSRIRVYPWYMEDAFEEKRDLDWLNQSPTDNLGLPLQTVTYRQHSLKPVEHFKCEGWVLGRRSDGLPWHETAGNLAIFRGPGSYHVSGQESDIHPYALYFQASGNGFYLGSAYTNGKFMTTLNGVYQECVYLHTDHYRFTIGNGGKIRWIQRVSEGGKIIPSYMAGSYVRMNSSPPGFSQVPLSRWYGPMISIGIVNNYSIPGVDTSYLRSIPCPWGEICAEAVATMPANWQGNGVALINDLRDCKSQALKTAESIRSLGASKHKLKAAASLYLSFHYGWKLLFSDLKELRDSLNKNLGDGFDHCTASRSATVDIPDWSCTCVQTYQVFINRWDGLFKKLDKFSQLSEAADLKLTLRSAWDLTKYSFVIDWFVDVGSVLNQIDSFYTLAYDVKTIAGGKSVKYSMTLKDHSVGNITASYYLREYSPTIVQPIPSFETHSPTTSIRNHWIEGGSLIVSR